MAAKKEASAKRPAHSVRVGPIEAAIWSNERKDGTPFHSVTFKRSYKDDADEWRQSNAYGERDCITLARAALEAQAWIAQQLRDAATSEDAA